jgi:hypothetical protein
LNDDWITRMGEKEMARMMKQFPEETKSFEV